VHVEKHKDIGGVSLLGLGAKAVESGGEAVSRPEGPRAGVRFLGRDSQPPLHQLYIYIYIYMGVWGRRCKPQPKLNLVHFKRKIWHLMTAND